MGFYAEQLILYVLGVASPTHPIDPIVYTTFIRNERAYGENEPFIHSWFGSHFTHQFSHAYVDFRNKRDADGVDWFENSVLATKLPLRIVAIMRICTRAGISALGRALATLRVAIAV